jgi:16S rRNA (cytosine967-C5)-methyltransferase
LVANELVPARAELVASAVRPVEDSVDVWVRDGTTIGQTERERFDRVLLDAPCTGLGALRRRPEARWRKVPRDVPQLVALQSALIDSAVLALKPGGLLAYVTCSPHLAETRLAVADALRRHEGELSELQTLAVLNRATDAPIGTRDESAHSRGGAVQLWPHVHGTDAMFIALLHKPLR